MFSSWHIIPPYCSAKPVEETEQRTTNWSSSVMGVATGHIILQSIFGEEISLLRTPEPKESEKYSVGTSLGR